MATTLRSHPTPSLAGLNPLALLRRALDGALAHFLTHRQRARELNELFGFDERELRDLGLSRSDFPSIQNGTFRRD
jgi:uncharacterized protein YjiS (DUF1127 family)